MKVPLQTRRAYWAAMAVGVAFVAALGYHVVCGEHGYLAYRSERRQYRALTRRVQDLEQQNQRLQKSIEALKSDPSAIEKQAREQLRLAKPGEIIYTLPDAPSKDQNATKGKPAPAPPFKGQ